MVDDEAAIEISAAQVQAAGDRELLSGEVLRDDRVVTLADKGFRIAHSVGLMPLLKFAHASNLRTDDDRALAAMYEILRDVILEAEDPCGKCPGCKEAAADATARDCEFADEGDWERFQEHAVRCKADAEELLDVVQQAIKLITARPTGSPPSSSGGRREISGNSTVRSSARQGGASRPSPRGRRATSR